MTVTSNTPTFWLVAAVFIFGDYPQKPWDEAMKTLERKVKYICKEDEIRPSTLWLLGRKIYGKHYNFLFDERQDDSRGIEDNRSSAGLGIAEAPRP